MDNLYFKFNCPPKMQDSRFITDYNHRDTLEDFYQSVLHSKSEHDYRKKLQENGEHIITGTLVYQMKNGLCNCQDKTCKL
jgi:hypothetical protein